MCDLERFSQIQSHNIIINLSASNDIICVIVLYRVGSLVSYTSIRTFYMWVILIILHFPAHVICLPVTNIDHKRFLLRYVISLTWPDSREKWRKTNHHIPKGASKMMRMTHVYNEEGTNGPITVFYFGSGFSLYAPARIYKGVCPRGSILVCALTWPSFAWPDISCWVTKVTFYCHVLTMSCERCRTEQFPW